MRLSMYCAQFESLKWCCLWADWRGRADDVSSGFIRFAGQRRISLDSCCTGDLGDLMSWRAEVRSHLKKVPVKWAKRASCMSDKSFPAVFSYTFQTRGALSENEAQHNFNREDYPHVTHSSPSSSPLLPSRINWLRPFTLLSWSLSAGSYLRPFSSLLLSAVISACYTLPHR